VKIEDILILQMNVFEFLVDHLKQLANVSCSKKKSEQILNFMGL